MRRTATPTGLRLLTGASELEATGIAQRACGNPFPGWSSHSRLKAKSGNIGVPRAHEPLRVEAHPSRSASPEYVNLSHFHLISSNAEVKRGGTAKRRDRCRRRGGGKFLRIRRISPAATAGQKQHVRIGGYMTGGSISSAARFSSDTVVLQEPIFAFLGCHRLLIHPCASLDGACPPIRHAGGSAFCVHEA